jgi:ParB-like chromosome segregation protein Spo0J
MSFNYEYAVHPLAALFPDLPPDEFQKLKKDIEDHGLIEAIILCADGTTLLDGRHRLKACKELGIEPKFVRCPYTAKGEANFIWARNVLRRHLTADQRAAIAVQWSDAERDAAKQRMKAGKPSGESTQGSRTRDAIAEKAKVSTHKIQQAERIAKHAPEVLPKVAAGEVKLKDAAKPPPRETVKPTPEQEHRRAVADVYEHLDAVRNIAIGRWAGSLAPVIRLLHEIADNLETLDRKREADKQKQEAERAKKIERLGVQVQ